MKKLFIFFMMMTCFLFVKTLYAQGTEMLQEVTDHGITWTFSEPSPVGQFITGDYYVVGAVTITAISPAPGVYSGDYRNGSVLNIPPEQHKTGFDSRATGGRFDASLCAELPISMVPGDSLASSISVDELRQTENWLREGNNEYSDSPVKSVSILTCLEAEAPADAFRPSYADRSNTIYRMGSVNRSLLPVLTPPSPVDTEYIRMFADRFIRPWVDNCFYGVDAQVEYMAMYGREMGRAMGIASLLLLLDLNGEQEELQEKLLIGMLQKGIDLWGLVQAGYPGWYAHGGHGSGRKWPIIFAGILFEDPAMRSPSITYPDVRFGEDMMTAYANDVIGGGPVWWNGSTVVYTGHMGIWNGEAVSSVEGWGPYEHVDPAAWANATGEGYRRCCTSNAWVGQALVARLMNAQTFWDHDAFFSYVDRWMDTTGDSDYTQYIYEARGFDYRASWQAHGWTQDAFVNEMWSKYSGRSALLWTK